MNMNSTMDITNAFGGMALGVLALIAFCAVVGLLLSIFWVWMLVDCANAPMNSGDKTAWVLIILFTQLLGAVLYYFIPRRERLRAIAPFPSVSPPPAGN